MQDTQGQSGGHGDDAGRRCPVFPVYLDEEGRTSRDYSPNDPENVADPYPLLREARATTPVFHSPRHRGFWTVTRYHDIREAARDAERLTSAVVGTTMPELTYVRDTALIPVETDDPLHAQYREILDPLLSPGAVKRLEPRVRAIARGLLRALPPSEVCDLVQDFTLPMVSRVLMLTMGMPEEDAGYVLNVTMRLFHGRIHNRAVQRAASDELGAYIERQIEDRARRPRGDHDLFTRLAQGRLADGRPLTHHEQHMYAANIFTAGFETTINGIGSSLWYLCEDLALRQRLIESPGLLPRAVEEFLRYFCPVQLFGRNATHDLELHGQRIKAGETVFLHYASGNRDETVFERPDEFDPERRPNPHLAFGYGVHFCMGAHLARLELRVAIGETLAAYPTYHLATEHGGAPERTPSGDQRGFWRLPVLLAEGTLSARASLRH